MPFKVHIAPIVGLCIAAVGVASNLGYFIDSSGTLFGPRYTLAAIFLLLCCTFVVTRASARGRGASAPVLTWLVAGFWPIGLLGLQAVALIRTGLTEDFLMVAAIFGLASLMMLFALYWRTSQYLYAIGHHGDYWKYLAWSVIVLCLASLSLRAIGFTGGIRAELIPSVSLALLGINANRASMPLFSGLNQAGVTYGATIICATILARAAGMSWKTPFLLLVALAAMGGLLWVDTRGALLVVPVALFFTLFKRRIRFGMIVLAVALIGLAILSGDVGSLPGLSRSGSDLSTSRVVIWGMALKVLLHPKLIHLVGYGAWGQYVSGLSREFYGLFPIDKFEIASLHNAIVQTLFDSGYLGMMFYVACWAGLIRTAWRQHAHEPTETTALRLGLAIYITMIGLTDAFAGYSSMASMFIYVGVLVGFSADLAYKRKVKAGKMIEGRGIDLSPVRKEQELND